MFSKDLELSISQAYHTARSRRHEFLTVEHLLLALLDNDSAVEVLTACGVDVQRLANELDRVLTESVPVLSEGDQRDTQPTIGFQRCPAACALSRAVGRAQGSAGRQRAGGDLRREGLARSLPAGQAGPGAAGRGQFPVARNRQDRRTRNPRLPRSRAWKPGRAARKTSRRWRPMPPTSTSGRGPTRSIR
jgi:hypothetical protein